MIPASIPGSVSGAPAPGAVAPHRVDSHKGADPESLKLGFANHLKYTLGKDQFTATPFDRYVALSLAIRDRIMERWIETQQVYHKRNVKRVYYLSMEFLMGRALKNNAINLGLEPAVRSALADLGLEWGKMVEVETDAGLGNGGLGRLAACFLDSMATMAIPATGYGLRYDYGIFNQAIHNGYQVEEPEEWLRQGNPWEVVRPEYAVPVRLGGRVEHFHHGARGRWRWLPGQTVIGLPYDTPIVGYGSANVNTLRLWSAKASQDFSFGEFNQGDYQGAVGHKTDAEKITKVLYPNEHVQQGKELRLRQEYFLVACSLSDVIRRFRVHNRDWAHFPDRVALQINDTHPALGIPELMRILVDDEGLPWEEAWDITEGAFGYTNHTLLPEACERWPVPLLEYLLPRHLHILYEINARFLKQVERRWPGDSGKLARMSVIEESHPKMARMANLAVIGSHSVNGVAALHSELVKTRLFPDFYALFPERFNNKTNGVTPRRWLLESNPELAELITETIGDVWVRDLAELRKLEPCAEDPAWRARFRAIKRNNKMRLSHYLEHHGGAGLNPDTLFDVQVKRLHEYKRQLLNLLHVIVLYNRLRRNPNLDMVRRTFLFGAKAAPGYTMAKLIIKLIHCVADVVNRDGDVRGRLKVHFLPNYRVSLAELIMPAADVSEQISTAGMEASGTGNMKFAMNGALTVGTLDGANVEISEEVGAENIFIFGLTAPEVEELRKPGRYNPREVLAKDPEIAEAVELLFSDFFNRAEPGIVAPVREALLDRGDFYMLLADLRAYADCQARVEALYRDEEAWTRKAILNVARSGKFSSDRTIDEYAREIWDVRPVRVEMALKKSDTMVQARGESAPPGAGTGGAPAGGAGGSPAGGGGGGGAGGVVW
ncbi:MAG: glycogen/starch/alpha-glucan phosphorylase [Planctomycetes bacterium]|nr:glycogen/starch/alpha-glucan phosphorylase [Planctomycetota bacterium]